MPDHQSLQVHLSRGSLVLQTRYRHINWPVGKLLDFAERINPRRSFLFVSKVLGKHIPVAPQVMQKTYQDLASLIPPGLPQPLTVIGMAETAICLAAGVHEALAQRYPDSVFITTTRHPLPDQPLLAEFLEEHSHAQSQLLYGSRDAAIQAHIVHSKSLILIDDEASTGKTFVNLVQALQKAGLQQLQQVVTATLVNWAPPLDLAPIISTEVSLLAGSWQWQANHQAPVPLMPPVDAVAQGRFEIIAPSTSGRIPLVTPHNGWIRLTPRFAGERVLVIGTCEYVWPPFLAAQALEQQGAVVKFASTTRSPIQIGHGIQAKLTFKDNYGQGMPNFIYNVLPEEYDRIVIIAETCHASIDPALMQLLPNAELITHDRPHA